jgi:hypothetical protein
MIDMIEFYRKHIQEVIMEIDSEQALHEIYVTAIIQASASNKRNGGEEDE